MRRKAIPEPGTTLSQELERLGLAPAQAAPLAARLVELARGVPEGDLGALLHDASPEASPPGSPEICRILEDFATELKKLDEGLRLLAAYLTRLRDHTRTSRGTSPAPRLH